LLFALALLVFFFHLPSLSSVENEHSDKARFADALRYRHLRLGVVAIFLYVGAEVSIGSFLISYIALPSIGGMSVASAAKYVSLYWGGAMVGRFLGAAVLFKANPRTVLGSCAIVGACLLAGAILGHGAPAVVAIVAIGLFNAVMFPNIFTIGIEQLGPLTGKASSLLIMAIVGGAIVPLMQGMLADQIGVQYAFVLPLVCYLYIAFYGFQGSKLDLRAVAASAGSPSFAQN
jgi:FHS family L-fucose permease-like MFS transporter